ncbi:MORN repeat-containing protein 3 isoform X1 [Hemicordylus capensis]|uniref:MORN repeat-containing protein 3 isoform X1 n=2 Tax=Hemicordylus capensis TaxID=884348 RepID=UPI00230211CA|nr:MORN repeat-containing protein 3 isoform X1 [Hemicordylus capensis]XP_053136161.1 MORN repeat-containing protein 3 isoform X1 [Hemicordylus capensis]
MEVFWCWITPTMDKDSMPIVKYPRTVDPLWYEWDRKAQKSGLRHTIYAVNGDHYTGEWLDNLKHGKGTQTWKKTGAIYSGEWKFGRRDGYGTYSIPDPVTKEYKKVYSGWWKNDKKCGFGIKFYSDSEYYEGEWNGGKRNGWGRMYYKDGSIFEGQWSEDKPGGQGMFRLKNENRYEGCWKDGKKHGPGKFFYLDTGQLYEGFWVADVPKCGTMIDLGRDEAPTPTQYPIPKVELADPDGVLEEAVTVLENAEELSCQPSKEKC